ncbi:hypothetical protein GCM10010430_77640 [Kitasatospora cystarginea]|uniref:Uncharacterized protein n=1 Tax=Kitasatospora cystarginea TaxID=58350 RepID=A0ABP5RZK2_9ACTN
MTGFLSGAGRQGVRPVCPPVHGVLVGRFARGPVRPRKVHKCRLRRGGYAPGAAGQGERSGGQDAVVWEIRAVGVDQEYAQQRIAEAIAAREAEEGHSWEQLVKVGAA